MRLSWLTPLALLLLFSAFAACGSEIPDTQAEACPDEEDCWSYNGPTGPASWGGDCQTGQKQSPIALPSDSARQEDLPPLMFEYSPATVDVINTGHDFTAPLRAEEQNLLKIGEDTYRLDRFHGHTPSEHTLHGRSYPMEVHFIHVNVDDATDLAVVGVFIDTTAQNPAYEPYVRAAANDGQENVRLDMLADMIPSNRGYFTYPGSLTTPGCTEGIRWIVLREPVMLSQTQVAVFRDTFGRTNRPPQALNDRVVDISR